MIYNLAYYKGELMRRFYGDTKLIWQDILDLICFDVTPYHCKQLEDEPDPKAKPLLSLTVRRTSLGAKQ